MWAQIAMQVVGQVANIMGTEMAVAGQRAAGKYNKNLLYQQAKMQEQAMERETELATKQGRRLKASQYASYAKSGAVPTSGTPLLTMVEQSGEMQRDILENRRNRMIQAEGLRHQGDVTYQQAKQQGYATRLAGISGSMNMGSSMMGMGGNKQQQQQPTLLSRGSQQTYGQFQPQMNTIANARTSQQFKYNF
jgi:hypothetical protein